MQLEYSPAVQLGVEHDNQQYNHGSVFHLNIFSNYLLPTAKSIVLGQFLHGLIQEFPCQIS